MIGKRISLMAACIALAVPAAVRAQNAADSAGIRAAALDYIEGWYQGNGDRMARALHPELVKRIMYADSAGRQWISTMGTSQLVRGTRAGGGTRTPAAQQRTDVRILDVFQNVAVARVDAGAWVDELQLVRWDGRWVILNVLWELRH